MIFVQYLKKIVFVHDDNLLKIKIFIKPAKIKILHKLFQRYRNQSTALVVPFFKILVGLKIELSELDLALGILNDGVLEADFSLLNVFDDFSKELLEDVANGLWVLDRYFIVVHLFQIGENFDVGGKIVELFVSGRVVTDASLVGVFIEPGAV